MRLHYKEMNPHTRGGNNQDVPVETSKSGEPVQSSWRLSGLEDSHLIYGGKRISKSFARILKETRL
ncbi:hypothetical protein BCR34DRAFT_559554 [Clohesyomyces aquaticus]|uniref:Uncharacterized protein n=1 Tax=Clohesyomyces aquaticus TaxID=1231657 RepID=A0A1Y1ZYD6_9PLEO|nr:hypothetical protein BCR34DRAFT_559554 [Clohesyomyces aquaticus]